MAVASIFAVLLIAVITRCKCDHTIRFGSNNGNSDSKFGDLLKPPPPPLLSNILPVPFYGGRNQRQNIDFNYPPPHPITSSASGEVKFPAPFYEQYNFNFLRSPQPFTTTSSPSLFQKVSTWFFPSEQTNHDVELTAYNNKNNNNNSPNKKDCNPCNLVPWVPVIRYNNLETKNVHQNSNPTYGPPSPTAFAQNLITKQPQFYYSQNEPKDVSQLRPAVPQVSYNSPVQSYKFNSNNQVSATYGPPSPTHIVETNLPNISGPTSSVPSNSYIIPNLSTNPQSISEDQSKSVYLASTQRQLSSSYVTTSTYTPSQGLYATPLPIQRPSSFYRSPHVGVHSYQPVTQPFVPEILNEETPKEDDVEIFNSKNNLEELRLPEVTHQTKFRNSYGDPIISKNILNVPYSMSAVAAESTKIHTQVLPEETIRYHNISVALGNPAPFTLNRGRNIHTLQPVALPNLSVLPLPPIFNARPFRPVKSTFPTFVNQATSQTPAISNNVNIAQSVPIVEFTHSVDYPATFIQSPVIEIDISKHANQTKEYRHIPNSFIIDEIRDITSQASEGHISATKPVSDSSFESTGSEIGNDLHVISTPADLKESPNIHADHQSSFTDLRGVKDEDVDKYRIESNLQNIDSPLLYLKPSIPHKKHGNFIASVSISPVVSKEYEIYDEFPVTTQTSSTSVITWDDIRVDYTENLNPLKKENEYKSNIVQIIVPYTVQKNQDNDKDYTEVSQSWAGTSKQEFQARKIPLHLTESTQAYSYVNTENTHVATTTEEPTSSVTENYGVDHYNSEINDFYDVKDPPFDIVKLQHTIDDWTVQEYSKEHKTLQRTRSSDNYAKQIPDEYFTTTVPINYETETTNYDYDTFDHEGASSIQHSVSEDNKNFTKLGKQYNTIERTKTKPNTEKSNILNDSHKPYIYTAASSFRTSTSTTSTTTTTTTTPAPWGKIQTSISPLTKEKVYVVTSKPWKETRNQSNQWHQEINSMKTYREKDVITSDSLPFKSPRFINRPSFGFTSGGKVESVKSESLFGFSRSWYQSINDLENQGQNNTAFLNENLQQDTNWQEDSTTTKPRRLRNL